MKPDTLAVTQQTATRESRLVANEIVDVVCQWRHQPFDRQEMWAKFLGNLKQIDFHLN